MAQISEKKSRNSGPGQRVGPLKGGVGEHAVTVLSSSRKMIVWWREDAVVVLAAALAKIEAKKVGKV